MDEQASHESDEGQQQASAVAVLEASEGQQEGQQGSQQAHTPSVHPRVRGFLPGPDSRRLDPRIAAQAKRPVRSVLALVDEVLQDDGKAKRAAEAFVAVLQDPENRLCVQAHALLNDRSDGPVVKQVEQRSTSARIVLQGPRVETGQGPTAAGSLPVVTQALVGAHTPESGPMQGPGVAAGTQANTAFQEQVLGALAGIGATLAALAGRVEALESRGTTAT